MSRGEAPAKRLVRLARVVAPLARDVGIATHADVGLPGRARAPVRLGKLIHHTREILIKKSNNHVPDSRSIHYGEKNGSKRLDVINCPD
jgi:hypothetical protein